MLSPAQLQAMSLPHLIAAAHAEIDALTSTPLELELLRRIEALADTEEDAEGFLALADGYDITPAQVRAVIKAHPESLDVTAQLLAVLNGEDIYAVDYLKKLLSWADKFQDIASDARDAGDVFDRLSQLATTPQE